MNKSLKVVLAVAVVIALAGAYMFPMVKQNLGTLTSPTLFDHIEFKQSFTKGGDMIATSSTAATYSLAANEWNQNTAYVSWLVNVNTTITTMASTSAPLVNLAEGESLEIYFYNASSTAAATATFAAGTGVDLQESEGGTVIVNGGEFARLTFLKKDNLDVALIVEGMQIGD